MSGTRFAVSPGWGTGGLGWNGNGFSAWTGPALPQNWKPWQGVQRSRALCRTGQNLSTTFLTLLLLKIKWQNSLERKIAASPCLVLSSFAVACMAPYAGKTQCKECRERRILPPGPFSRQVSQASQVSACAMSGIKAACLPSVPRPSPGGAERGCSWGELLPPSRPVPLPAR